MQSGKYQHTACSLLQQSTDSRGQAQDATAVLYPVLLGGVFGCTYSLLYLVSGIVVDLEMEAMEVARFQAERVSYKSPCLGWFKKS